MARTRLAEGVYVDIYNLHAQAGTNENETVSRRANILQLVEYIEDNSSGNAVIVMGDTNTRYTRTEDNIRELLHRGFIDVWASRIRGGHIPESGTAALVCDPAITSRECEVVDKILYRDNGYVGLRAVAYAVRQDAYNEVGEALSDHPPIQADWIYQTPPDRRLSDQLGGPHGNAFNDMGILPEKPAPTALSIRSGNRVDRVEITLAEGYVLSHGGNGGSVRSLSLRDGEYLSSMYACPGKTNDHTRIFYTRFTTNQGRILEGGSITSNCEAYTAPDGWQIVGFHGRSKDELDKIGVIFAPYDDNTRIETANYVQFVNNASGLCMDIRGADMTAGADVIQWTCNDGDWQKWNYDAHTGLIRSKQDSRFCLDNSGTFGDGADIRVQRCNGSANQRFLISETGVIRMHTFQEQVVDGYGTAVGDGIGTWTYRNSENQRWQIAP